MRAFPCACAGVRDYEFDQELQANQSEASQSMKTAADTKRAQLEQWSATAYGEVRIRALFDVGMVFVNMQILALDELCAG